MKLSSKESRDIYLSLSDVIQTEFDAGQSHLAVLKSLAQRGGQLFPHPDWSKLDLLADMYQSQPIETFETVDAEVWVLSQVPKMDFARLNVLAHDDWLLIPSWEAGLVESDKSLSDRSIGPNYIPAILADAARICVGWHAHSEFTYSVEELQDMKRQGHLTRQQGEGPDHLGQAALLPVVIWGCLAELQKYSRILKAAGTLPKNTIFRGGYSSGDSFTFHPQD